MSVTRDRINTFFRYKDLLRELVVRDVKLKYRRSFLGYVWSILNPLLIMLVMTLVFSQMFQRGIENFPVYLLTGQALFDFMNNATHMSMYSVLDNGALIKKIYVPKYISYLIKSNKFPDRPYFFNGSIDSGHADHQSTVFTIYPAFSIGSDSAVYLCMRIGLFPFCCECFLSRYSVYLQCHHSSMDVCNSNVLPDRAASGLAQKAGRIL